MELVLLAMTIKPLSFERSVMISSAIPSPKKSCCGSPLKLMKGSTAMAGFSFGLFAGGETALGCSVSAAGAIGALSVFKVKYRTAPPLSSSNNTPAKAYTRGFRRDPFAIGLAFFRSSAGHKTTR